MGYGRRHLRRSGELARTAIKRRQVRRAARLATIAALAGLSRTMQRQADEGDADALHRDGGNGA